MKRDKNISWHDSGNVNQKIKGLQIAIIGGTGGIGRALSQQLAAHGADVLVVGQTFRDAGKSGISFLQADLSLMSEAQRVATALPAETLDMLIFTTGIFAAPQRQETAEGIERDLAVSFLNRKVIFDATAPRLGRLRPGDRIKPRVFIMGYPGSGQIGKANDLNAERSYKALPVHMNTVAGNEMLVLQAANHYPHISVFGLNPGLIKTNIRDNWLGKDSFKARVLETLIGWFAPTADSYARSITPLLVSDDLGGYSGVLFNRKGQAILSSEGLSETHIRTFMSAASALIARTGISEK